jgi:hypothetical protein
MKKLVMVLMAFCLTMPVTVNGQSKEVKKLVKAKLKDYKKSVIYEAVTGKTEI